MLSTRRSFLKTTALNSSLNTLIVAPLLAKQNQTGTAIVMRLADRRILHAENADFAAGAVLPPASTIKPFTILALLELGKLRSDELFPCPRRLRIKGHAMDCVHPPLPVAMNPARAIAYSCNGAVAHFALRFAEDEFAQALVRFGFTSQTGILKIAEAAGSVRRGTASADCQLQALGEEGIGVTPLELLLAYARLAERVKGPVLEGLEGAVAFGTAQAAQVSGVSVAGKTGSIVLRSGSAAAWFAGFAPSRNPKAAVVVVTAGRSGGADAAPIAGELLRRYLGPV